MARPLPATPLEQLDALVGLLEEGIADEEFVRALRKSGGGEEVRDCDTPMPFTRAFKDHVEELRKCVVELAAASPVSGSPSAGDLFLIAVDEWLSHLERAHDESDDCQDCELLVNRVRLARKVYQNSAHKSLVVSGSPSPQSYAPVAQSERPRGKREDVGTQPLADANENVQRSGPARADEIQPGAPFSAADLAGALRALRDQWREKANGPIPTDRAIGFDECADQLDALIAKVAAGGGET